MHAGCEVARAVNQEVQDMKYSEFIRISIAVATVALCVMAYSLMIAAQTAAI